jgi:hypothetical protein
MSRVPARSAGRNDAHMRPAGWISSIPTTNGHAYKLGLQAWFRARLRGSFSLRHCLCPRLVPAAIHENTDGQAILRRVFSEPIEPGENDLGPDHRDEGI